MKRAIITLALIATPLAARNLAEEALSDPAKETQAVALMDTIRCIVCQGEPISGSNAEIAGDMRRLIRERIEAGEQPEAIRAWLVNRYGDWVSLKPEFRADTAVVWVVPLFALLCGGWLAARRLRRKRK
jgi:cytochrome c-type biogenesis protein CcmH